MKRPLQPKPRRPVADIALALKQCGYDPIELRGGKDKPFKGWPEASNTPEEIARWTGKSAAVRMAGSGGLVCFDMDIKDATLRDRVLERWRERWPDFMNHCLRRNSGAVTLALFGRMTTQRKTLHSSRWGKSEQHPKGHLVEVFTSRSIKYVVVWGVHSPGRQYAFEGDALWQVPLDQLPEFLDADIPELLNIVEEVMRDAGMAMDTPRSSATPDVLFDLTPDMELMLEDGALITLKDFCELYDDGEWHYCYANLFDPASTSPTRARAKVTSGGLTIYDFKKETRHHFKRVDPVTPELVAAVKALHTQTQMALSLSMFELSEDMPPQPDERNENFDIRLQWLLRTHGHYSGRNAVVRLYAEGSDCLMPVEGFINSYAPWRVMGDRNKPVTAPHMWMINGTRLRIASIQLRPDQPFPVFNENGAKHKNTYRKPRHVGDGDIVPWQVFMEHLLPDPVEREWFVNWLAHKWRRPEVPGVGVVMVAATVDGPVYGAGRGILCDILERLLGARYVRHVDFDLLTGQSSQSKYTGWSMHSLLVTVSEARDTADSGKWAQQRATYERLKEIIEPRIKTKFFHVKYGAAADARSHTSYLVASNNIDALQIPTDDRRLAVLRNGGKMTTQMARELTTWMEVPGNIAALARSLEERDLTAFDVYTPLHTETKERMQALADSEFDLWKRAVREKIGRGALFTRADLRVLLLEEAGANLPKNMETFDWMVRRWARAACDKVAGGKNWRMLAEHGGEVILQWEDYIGPVVADMADARARVLAVRKRRPVGVLAARLGTAVESGGDA